MQDRRIKFIWISQYPMISSGEIQQILQLRFTVPALGYPSFIWPCKAEIRQSWQIHSPCFHETSVSLLGWLPSCDSLWRCAYFKSGPSPEDIWTRAKRASPHLSVSVPLFASSCPPSSLYFSLGACLKKLNSQPNQWAVVPSSTIHMELVRKTFLPWRECLAPSACNTEIINGRSDLITSRGTLALSELALPLSSSSGPLWGVVKQGWREQGAADPMCSFLHVTKEWKPLMEMEEIRSWWQIQTPIPFFFWAPTNK